MNKQTEALKLALEALEETRNALAWFYDSYPEDVTPKGNELLPHVEVVLTAIREALAEQPAQQQEPAAEITAEDMGRPFNAIRIGTHFYKEVPPVGTKLYTSPPASKPWVGLTQDELNMIGDKMRTWNSHSLVDVYTAIEAKLREKNA